MEKLVKKLQAQLEQMVKTGQLFRSALTGDQIWNLYLESFKKEDNPIFRDPNSTYHTCNNCKNFIRRYGNIVTVKDNQVISIFDIKCSDEYKPVVEKLCLAISKSNIANVFFETFNELNSLPYESCSKDNKLFQLGVAKNVKRYTKEEAEKFGVVKTDETRTFHHLHLFLPKEFVNATGTSVEAIMGSYRDVKNVFQRAMEEISLDTLNLVRDLIKQGSLLNGEAHLKKIEQIIPFKQEYDSLKTECRDAWCWSTSYKLPYAKFKNELIGVLCSELTQGEELNKACQSWNKRVDPANYMKASAPITKKQIAEAKEFVEENGYAESFDRRCATIDDIKVSEIKHINIGTDKVKSISVFDDIKPTATRHKRSEFDGVEEINIDKFMKDILPTCTMVEAYLSNKHGGNLVTLTTANNPESKRIFKWDNNYSWTFNGNLAGKSEIKEAVKELGGKIDGALRFTISWNRDGKDILDFDAHAKEPRGGNEIYYSTAFRKDRGNQRTPLSGQLDIDMINPTKMGIENIVWDNLSKMKDGEYKLWIHNFNSGRNTGFQAEVEFDGEIYSYEYSGNAQGNTQIAEVTLKNGQFSIKHLVPESAVSSKEVYDLETNHFHKVNMICLSPNHWEDNAVGNKHYIFMLHGCKAPTSLRGFHNENLTSDLLKYRKVMEVLGATNHADSTEKQLSGLGFNATVRDELIVKVAGTHKRMLKIKF